MYVHCTVEHLLKAYSSTKNKKKNKQKTCCRPRSLSNFDRTPYPDTSLGSALCNSHYSLFSSFFFLLGSGQAGRQACAFLINFINCRATLSNGFQLARRHLRFATPHITEHSTPPKRERSTGADAA